MNIYSKFSLLFFICGIAFFVIGILEGTIEGGIFIIFPFLIGSGIYALFGIIFFFFSFLFYMVGLYSNTEEFINLQFGKNKKDIKSVKGGGVILIGPIPIIFGSNWKIAIVMMVLALLLIIVSFLLFKII